MQLEQLRTRATIYTRCPVLIFPRKYISQSTRCRKKKFLVKLGLFQNSRSYDDRRSFV